MLKNFRYILFAPFSYFGIIKTIMTIDLKIVVIYMKNNDDARPIIDEVKQT